MSANQFSNMHSHVLKLIAEYQIAEKLPALHADKNDVPALMSPSTIFDGCLKNLVFKLEALPVLLPVLDPLLGQHPEYQDRAAMGRADRAMVISGAYVTFVTAANELVESVGSRNLASQNLVAQIVSDAHKFLHTRYPDLVHQVMDGFKAAKHSLNRSREIATDALIHHGFPKINQGGPQAG